MATVNIKVGQSVYETYVSHLNKERITIEYKVVHVASNSFKTDDGRRWAIGKYDHSGTGTFRVWGHGYRGAIIRTTPGKDERILLHAEARRELDEEMTFRREAKNQRTLAMVETFGIDRAIEFLLRETGGSYGATEALRGVRNIMETDEQKDAYVVAIEYKLAEATRTLREYASQFKSLARSAQGYVESYERSHEMSDEMREQINKRLAGETEEA